MIKIYVCILIACFLAFDAEALDNDDLAFTFVSGVDECAEAGIYTPEQAKKHPDTTLAAFCLGEMKNEN